MEHLNNITLTENFEMLKTLYEFQAVYPKTISFDEGEYFILHQTSTKQRNWWQVISIKGSIGFVPSNYVTKVQVEPSFLLEFLKSCIATLKLSEEDDLNGIITRTELIEKLETKREQIEFSYHVLQDDNKDSSMHENNIQNNDEQNTDNKEEETNKSEGINRIMDNKLTINNNNNNNSNISNSHNKTFQPMDAANLISTIETKCDDLYVNACNIIAHDNSIASEPSETTNTISEDEPTILSTSDKYDSEAQMLAQDDQKELPTLYNNNNNINNDNNNANNNNNNDNNNNDNNNNINNDNNNNNNNNDNINENGNTSNGITDDINNVNTDNNDIDTNNTEKNTINDITSNDLLKNESVSSIDVYQIIDVIRQTTDLSHDLSCKALRVVLTELETIFPSKLTCYLETMAVHLTTTLSVPDEIIERTHDAQHLQLIFSQLADCKNDSQQRTWMLHEDENYIKQFLSQLIDILEKADKKISRYVLKCDNYQSIINLIQYYQMEMRWPIKNLLLDAFKILCHLDATVIDVLLISVLPMELVQDMKSNSTNIERLKDLSIMLTMIFSIGQCMPVNHQEHIGTDFVLFLLNIIEDTPEADTTEMLPDFMISLLLSFNLQFEDFTNNIVLNAIRELNCAKNLTEKILLLLNREDDPVKMFEHSSLTTNSVLKLFIDLFSTMETASLFYTNDNKVLIDIIVRQLSDISPGDLRRRSYLELCRRILRNTNYIEHTHRKQDLMKIFTRIFCEETECSIKDQQLVRQIANEFPKIFKS